MHEIQIYLSCRNEQDAISESIRLVNDVVKKYNLDAEIIVVDNNSDDQTANITSQIMTSLTELRLLRLVEDKSYSGSIYASISDSTAAYVFILDGDCQFSPSYIPRMFEMLKHDGAEIVFTNRTRLVGDPWRRFASRVFLQLIRLTLNFDGPDINAGLRGFKVSTKRNFVGLQRGRLANASLWHQAKSADLKINFIDVSPVLRTSGSSSIPWRNPIRLFLESMAEIKKIKSGSFEFRFSSEI